ncbi:oligosaccharide repeat unit polymerase [Deinococcus sp. Arct2-2]|uniref:O-antigen polymerase n=1 Tax=Deinococcus sp. Arct2-2 TaxID=2568653 RepID=UPI0010A59152|nr:O-antigen polymerase [Deinococcus sp. Arct2-2]THF69521.1 oligosaccharide repeat unit polymerase [Deinococcus sp. Arct2-2]
MLILICALFCFSFGLLFNSRRVNPLTLFSAQWILVGFFYILFNDRYFTISTASQLILCSYMLIFSFGLITMNSIIRKLPSIGTKATENINTQIIYIIFFSLLIISPFIANYILETGRNGPTSNIFVNIRYRSSVEFISLGVYQYVIAFSLIFMAYLGSLYYSGVTRLRNIFYLTLSLTFILHSLTLARGQMISVIIVYMILSYGYRRLNRLKLVATILLPLIIFISISVILNKTSSSLLFTISDYLVPPSIAFDISINMLETTKANQNGILYSISQILKPFGFEIDTGSIILGQISTPITTNLYTFLAPYYTFGGYFGVLLVSIILGMQHAILYSRETVSHTWRVLYAFSIIPLLSHYGGDQYVSITSYWLQVLFWVSVLGLTNSRRKSDVINSHS